MIDDPDKIVPAADRGGPTTTQRRRRRWVRRIAVLILLVAIILVAMPFGIGFGLIKWLESQGVDSASVGNVDFNPFTAEVALYDVRVINRDRQALEAPEIRLNLAWLPLLQKRLHIESASIVSTELEVAQVPGGVIVGGILLAPGAAAKNGQGERGWGLEIAQWRMVDSTLRTRSAAGELRVGLREVVLTGLSSQRPEAPGELSVAGSVDGAPFSVRAELRPFNKPPNWNSRIELAGVDLSDLRIPGLGLADDRVQGGLSLSLRMQGGSDAGGALHTQADGSIQLRDWNVRTPDLEAAARSVAWQGMFRLDQSAPRMEFSADGKIVTEALNLRAVSTHLIQDELSWSGQARLEINEQWGGPRLTANGELQGNGVNVRTDGSDGATRVGRARWQGQVGYGTQDVPTDISARGDLTLERVELERPAPSPLTVGAARIRTEDITAHGTQEVTARTIQLDDVTLDFRPSPGESTDGNEPLVRVGRARMQGTGLEALNELDVERVQLDTASMSLRRDAQGRWNLPLDTNKQQPAPAEGPGFRTRIGVIEIGNNSRLHYADASIEPAYESTLALDSARLERLDSGEPRQLSPFSISGRIGEYTRLSGQGQIAPLASPLSADLSAEVGQLDLPPLSGYTVRQLGYRIESGHLDADVTVEAADGAIEGKTHLAMDNLRVAPIDAEQMRELTQALTMPLESGLALLRDKNDKIELDVNVQGNTADPRFDFSDAFNQAIGKAIKFTAMTYLKHTLQPYGTVLLLAELAGKAADAIQLKPVLFAPGSAELTAEARDYTKHLASLLDQRPQLKLRLCPRAVQADRDALTVPASPGTPTSAAETEGETPKAPAPPRVPSEAELLQLAKTRAEAIKQQLTRDLAIEPGRIFVCQPEFEPQQGAEPWVRPTL